MIYYINYNFKMCVGQKVQRKYVRKKDLIDMLKDTRGCRRRIV